MRMIMPVMGVLMLHASPVFSQTAPTPAAKSGPATRAPMSVCAGLAADYVGFSKDLAANNASSVGDNSAPRATLREMEDANTLARAKMTLDLMRDNRCTMPRAAPNASAYLLPALTCATDRLKASGADRPSSCDRNSWKATGEE